MTRKQTDKENLLPALPRISATLANSFIKRKAAKQCSNLESKRETLQKLKTVAQKPVNA